MIIRGMNMYALDLRTRIIVGLATVLVASLLVVTCARAGEGDFSCGDLSMSIKHEHYANETYHSLSISLSHDRHHVRIKDLRVKARTIDGVKSWRVISLNGKPCREGE
jgi:hypothetical protein